MDGEKSEMLNKDTYINKDLNKFVDCDYFKHFELKSRDIVHLCFNPKMVVHKHGGVFFPNCPYTYRNNHEQCPMAHKFSKKDINHEWKKQKAEQYLTPEEVEVYRNRKCNTCEFLQEDPDADWGYCTKYRIWNPTKCLSDIVDILIKKKD